MTKRTSLEELAGTDSNNVPQPPSRWALRFGIPLLVITAAVILLLVTAWSALVPATPVQAITVAVRPVELEEVPMNMESGSVVQAPGWIEPDPFPTYVAALEQGIVEDILKVEGDSVKIGISAPREIAILRKEIIDEMHAFNKEAVSVSESPAPGKTPLPKLPQPALASSAQRLIRNLKAKREEASESTTQAS